MHQAGAYREDIEMTELESALLAKASRREIHADVEARLLGVEISQVKRAIASLRRKALIYTSSGSKTGLLGCNARRLSGATHPERTLR
jgi:hypothetical protein